jgi:hypothetical protein
MTNVHAYIYIYIYIYTITKDFMKDKSTQQHNIKNISCNHRTQHNNEMLHKHVSSI